MKNTRGKSQPGPRGNDAYLAVWKAVRRVPRGRVSTYGAIARVARMPGQARLVGYALHNLPEGADVPWHRVVNAAGKISFRQGEGARSQRALLAREGVRFVSDRVPLATFGWPVREFH